MSKHSCELRQRCGGRRYTAAMKVWLATALGLGLMVGGMRAQEVAVPASPAADASKPVWQVELEKRRLALITRNGSGTDKALAERLMAMRESDQAARGISNGQPQNAGKTTTALNLNDVDAQNTAELKAIVAEKGWPTIALVGIEASNAAMLLLTHTRDHAWQASLLPQLETLADTGKIDGSALAVVIDKELIGEGQLQRYGTQWKYVDGAMSMYGVEDPAGLDARRAQVFLPPMSVYRTQLEGMYHLKATDKVVMAVKPAAAVPSPK
jgi:hypothetical protein